MADQGAMLAGKAVVVTGAGRGIGAAYARGIAAQGGSVVVNDVNGEAAEQAAAAIEADGGKAIAHVADISDWDAAGGLVEACQSRFGKIDGLVNNAALFHVAPVQALDPAIIRGMVEVNVLGAAFCIAHAVKPMLAQGSGSIVNVSSGAHLGMRSTGVYGLTKGAVASMIYTWAIELAQTGVRINGVSPIGATNLTANSQEYLREKHGVRFDESKPAQPAPGMQRAEDNSPLVEFLLSDAAVDVNGQIFRIEKGAVQLYAHPMLLLPAARCENWTARGIADTFAAEFKDRQLPCGPNWGIETLPVQVDLTGGGWKAHQRQRG